jgi:hypothetical protein
MDKDILHHYDATIIGYVASVNPDLAEVDPATIVLQKFKQYIKVLGKELADKLPDHKPYDYNIDLKDGKQPPWGPMYPQKHLGEDKEKERRQQRPPPAFSTTSTETFDFSIGFGFAALIYVSL